MIPGKVSTIARPNNRHDVSVQTDLEALLPHAVALLDTQKKRTRADEALRWLGQECSSGLSQRIDREIKQLVALGTSKLSAKKVHRDIRHKANRVRFTNNKVG
jgi:hypothetical protein